MLPTRARLLPLRTVPDEIAQDLALIKPLQVAIEAAQAAGVRFDYDTGFDAGDFDTASGEVKLGERTVKPRIVVGCDGVHEARGIGGTQKWRMPEATEDL